MLSVNTNIGAMVALQNLSQTQLNLESTQKRVSTGKIVEDAKDNGAVWAIANKMTSDVDSYDVVTQSTDRANSILDTATAAANSIMDLLNQMKSKALAATQTGISATSLSAYNADYQELKAQITSAITNATFDGVNMINGTPANAVALGDATGNPANSITINGADLSVGGGIVTITAASDLLSSANAQTALGLVNSSIDNLSVQLATWGAGSERLAVHKLFVSKLQDALNAGIGSLVDADMAKESARLQALQVQQQLGVQALSIANQAPQAILNLFR